LVDVGQGKCLAPPEILMLRSRGAILDAPKAFTLLELLVVVGIIGLLAAVMLPAVTQVREKALRMTCTDHMRQLGVALAAYGADYRFRLPTHSQPGEVPFDAFCMSSPTGQSVNLGLLQDYVGENAEVFYCPGQSAEESPDIAYDSPQNRWRWRRGIDAAPSGPAYSGPPPIPADAEPGPNAGYDARSLPADMFAAPAWAMANYSNKVIYSDFIGVDGWEPRGRFTGQLCAPHGAKGYNRLFGDGSVLWAPAETVNHLRPVGADEPTPQELDDYYELLDVMP
jgi:prepilin-type N-terminal cleavage/methylation domain-containing protein